MTDFNTLPVSYDAIFDDYYEIIGTQSYYNSNVLPIDEIQLINCPPQGIAPSDLSKVIGNLTAELEVKKYYVSELIGIKAGDHPLYEIFPCDIINMPSTKQEEAITFLSKIYQLMDGNDLCDKQGIRFIGKYLKHYCPNSANYNKLNAEQAQFINYLLQSTALVVEQSKKWANCK